MSARQRTPMAWERRRPRLHRRLSIIGFFRGPTPMSAVTPNRLLSLDVFRGMTIAAMTLVNNPGTWSAIYWPLEHAEWNGWTPTDLVFPFFLFIVGASITLAFGRRLEDGAPRRPLYWKVVKRSLIIFGLG